MSADAIVKALKCCNVPSGRACSECPYHEAGAKCRTKRNKDAAELIVKLIDENRELRSDLKYAEEEYERVYEQAEADIRGNIADGGTSCHWCIAGHRANAIKQMQKKLTSDEFYIVADEYNGMQYVDFCAWVDDIVKEILEENNV